MAKILVEDLEVCEDCAQVIANGEISDGSGGDTARGIAEAQRRLWGDDARGLVLDWCGSSGSNFSWSPCDGCGAEYAGLRHAAVILTS